MAPSSRSDRGRQDGRTSPATQTDVPLRLSAGQRWCRSPVPRRDGPGMTRWCGAGSTLHSHLPAGPVPWSTTSVLGLRIQFWSVVADPVEFWSLVGRRDRRGGQQLTRTGPGARTTDQRRPGGGPGASARPWSPSDQPPGPRTCDGGRPARTRFALWCCPAGRSVPRATGRSRSWRRSPDDTGCAPRSARRSAVTGAPVRAGPPTFRARTGSLRARYQARVVARDTPRRPPTPSSSCHHCTAPPGAVWHPKADRCNPSS